MTLEDFAKQGLFTSDRKVLKDEQEQLKLDISYTYWFYALLERVARIFQWKGLDNICDQRQLELRVLADGFCGFVNDELVGFMVTRGSLNGITEYSDYPIIGEYTNFLYANPIAKGGNPVIGKECTICNNTAFRTSILPMIKRYASLLAHAEISVKCSLVSLRENEIFVVEDDATKNNVVQYHKKIYKGEPDVIVDRSLVNAIQDISQSKGSSNQATLQAIDVRNQLLRAFYQDMGVRYTMDKKERMVTSEVQSDNQVLLVNVNDMLKYRQKFADETNALFGTNLSVDYSEEFQYLKDEPEEEGEMNNETEKVY